MIDNVLYYISGKTKIKIKEHFAETKVTALDLVESAIKYENRTKIAGYFLEKNSGHYAHITVLLSLARCCNAGCFGTGGKIK